MLSNEEKYHQTWIDFELSHFQVAIAIRIHNKWEKKETNFIHAASFVHSLTPTTHAVLRRFGVRTGVQNPVMRARQFKSGELT